MIAEEDYLKAKQIVQEYEREHSNTSNITYRSVAVISLNRDDFQLWKLNNKLQEDGLGTRRKFQIGNVRYYCISKVYELCSFTLDEITETDHAKENEEYEQIRSAIKIHLRSPNDIYT